jgi:hypothetical protein
MAMTTVNLDMDGKENILTANLLQSSDHCQASGHD